jgi:hypothetical protein
MVLAGSTGDLPLHERLPNPFSHTEAPRRPTTTTPPGKPPALIAREITELIFASLVADMPTAPGDLEGSPPSSPLPVRRVSAVRSDVSKAKPYRGRLTAMRGLCQCHYWGYAALYPNVPVAVGSLGKMSLYHRTSKTKGCNQHVFVAVGDTSRGNGAGRVRHPSPGWPFRVWVDQGPPGFPNDETATLAAPEVTKPLTSNG